MFELSLQYFVNKELKSLIQNSQFPTLENNLNKAISALINRDGIPDVFSGLEIENISKAIIYINDQSFSGTNLSSLIFLKYNSNSFASASHPHLLGAIFLTSKIDFQDIYFLSKSIIHELAHYELFLINFFDRLILEPHDQSLMFSPFQGRERPPIGRLHSYWAVFRMIQFSIACQKYKQEDLDMLHATELTLSKEVLTPMAVKLINASRSYIETIV